MGAEAIAQLIDRIDLDEEEVKLREAIDADRRPAAAVGPAQAEGHQAPRRSSRPFNRRDDHGRRVNDPRAMILEAVPVIPPDLRPMVQLDGGRFATSDLNDLYRRVINRNNRLKRLLDLGAPEIIINNEKRMLQEAVDALFDNGRRGRPVTGPGNRPAQEPLGHAEGQAGPVPPEPARQARRLLGPFGHRGRPDAEAAPVRAAQADGARAVQALRHEAAGRHSSWPRTSSRAKRMVERRRAQVWDVLEEVIKEHPVLLNRAPTLHRLGIQAFEPVLVEGKAIQIHPLVCTAFNADFDGDQMAVHLPLSAEAQAEARILMLSANNILSPGDRSARSRCPTQDMVFGAYYLTLDGRRRQGRGPRSFRTPVRGRARLRGRAPSALHAKIKLRPRPTVRRSHTAVASRHGEDAETEEPAALETTPGRVFFNAALPRASGYVNDVVGKRATPIGAIVEEARRPLAQGTWSPSQPRPRSRRSASASRPSPGLTISIDDVADAAGQGGDPRPLRGGGREGRDAVQARHHHRRRAAPEGDRDLDRRRTPRSVRAMERTPSRRWPSTRST